MKHELRPTIHMEKSVNSLDELISWVDGVSGDFQGGANSVRLMKSHIWHPPAGSVGGKFRKGTVAFVHLDADFSVSPCMPLVPFKLLPW